jgi:dodecin
LSDATYRIIEITGTSTEGVQQAIDSGVARANATLRNLDWIEVQNIRGHLEEGRVAHYQVTMKVGFRLED